MKVTIGIDVSKEWLDFAVVDHQLQTKLECQVDNTKQGIRSFIKQAKDKNLDVKQSIWVIEATGIYAFTIMDFAKGSKVDLAIVNANQINKSSGIARGTNDKLAALKIAQYGVRYADKLRIWEPPSQRMEQLKTLFTARERCLKMIHMASVPIEEIGVFDRSNKKLLDRSFRQSLKALKKDLEKMEKQIRQIIDDDENFRKLKKIVTSVPGIGDVNFWAFLIATNQFQNFSSAKKLAAYAGVVPYPNQSGKSKFKKSKTSKHSNRKLNAKLTMAARAAIRVKGEFQEYYNRKLQEGKQKSTVLNAIKNKLVLRIYACVKQQRIYQKNYVHSLA